jgi:gamma-glutamyltranspeptidase / glutathione hydrolase
MSGGDQGIARNGSALVGVGRMGCADRDEAAAANADFFGRHAQNDTAPRRRPRTVYFGSEMNRWTGSSGTARALGRLGPGWVRFWAVVVASGILAGALLMHSGKPRVSAAAPSQTAKHVAGADPIAEVPRPRRSTTTRQLALSPGKRSVAGVSGMVVSVNAEATRIGIQLLQSGGNAVDAAVGVALGLAVTHPSAGNIGGGGFALVRLANGETLALDFRESSPATLDRERFARMIRNQGEGRDSVAIPGSVAGLFELASRLGRLPFASLVEPARQLAATGHRVSIREAAAIRTAWPRLKRHPLTRQRYGIGGEQPVPEGSWLKLPALAATLSRLATEGRAGFYSGPVAASIVASLGPDPQIREADLASYRAIWRQPLEIAYRGTKVSIVPPPSAGGVALATSLTLLSAYDPATLRRGSAEHAHLLLEIMRRAQADRIYGVVDPDIYPAAQAHASLAQLLAPERWPTRCPIDPNHASLNERVVEADEPQRNMEHTTHLAVVDSSGMAVSLTTTLSSGFGSKVMTDSGIILNNALASFSGKGLNQPLPNRRTTSSMAPSMVEDSLGLRLVVGSPGGDTIPSTLLQLLNSLIDYSVPLDDAVDAPRLHQSVAPHGQARMESARPIPVGLQRDLIRRGHRFVNPTAVFGHANSIAVIDGHLYGYVDPREGGLALGWTAE